MYIKTKQLNLEMATFQMANFHRIVLLFALVQSTLSHAPPTCRWTPELSICEYVQLGKPNDKSVACNLHSLHYCICDDLDKLSESTCEQEGKTQHLVKTIDCGQNRVCCPEWSQWSECHAFGFSGKQIFDLQRYRFRKCPCPLNPSIDSSSSYFLTFNSFNFACYEVINCHKKESPVGILTQLQTQKLKPIMNEPNETSSVVVESFSSRKIVPGSVYLPSMRNEVKEDTSQPLTITTVVAVILFCCITLVIIVAFTILFRMRRARNRQLQIIRRSEVRLQQRRRGAGSQRREVIAPSYAVNEWLGTAVLPTSQGELAEVGEDGSSVPECFVTSDGAVHVRKPPHYEDLPIDGGLPSYSFQVSSVSLPEFDSFPPGYTEEDEIASNINTPQQTIPFTPTPPSPRQSPQNR